MQSIVVGLRGVYDLQPGRHDDLAIQPCCIAGVWARENSSASW
jgi:hypothetical protein